MKKGAKTRELILNTAGNLIYTNGYQKTSIDEIIKQIHVTKGSFFYHFKNKEEMGLAVINEMMLPQMKISVNNALNNSDNPLVAIYEMMAELLANEHFFNVHLGCPAVNLISEMSSFNDSFNRSLNTLNEVWRSAIEKNITKSKSLKLVDSSVSAYDISIFILSGYNGIRNLGKIYGRDSYNSYLSNLYAYLNNLKIKHTN